MFSLSSKIFSPEYRDLAWVPRWSIIRVNRRQSVAEHSFYVTLYGLEIARLIGWPKVSNMCPDEVVHADRYLLALYLLRHDEGEALEGDMPGPIKRIAGYNVEALAPLLEARFGPAPQPTDDMKSIKKVADLIDECLFLAGELNSGNQAVRTTLENSRDRLAKAVRALPVGEDVADNLHRFLESKVFSEIHQAKNIKGFAGI